MHETRSVPCPVSGFHIRGIELSGSATGEFEFETASFRLTRCYVKSAVDTAWTQPLKHQLREVHNLAWSPCEPLMCYFFS